MRGPNWTNPDRGVTGEKNDRMVGVFPDGTRLVKDPILDAEDLDQIHPFTD